MKTQAVKRLRRAAKRIEILKARVRWWGAASLAERLAVLRAVRQSYPNETGAASVECNWYNSAAHYLNALEYWRHGPTAEQFFGDAASVGA